MRKGFLVFIVILSASVGALVAMLLPGFLGQTDAPYGSFEDRQKSWWADHGFGATQTAGPVNFTSAARRVRPAVVHIQTKYGGTKGLLNKLKDDYEGGSIEDFFKQQEEGYRNFHDFEGQPEEASGSGVIISDDGYIVTNNHVVAKASEITVILDDKRRYKAKLIGADPTTDLALLRVEGRNLPFISFGNSDSLEIGEWVLAVGNPFELTSTVTAGIVSAKARNINILGGKNNLAVESFIQTDAAVNPGNSGGALVNLRGELIGINTAIASTTGTYTGYSFAIPISLAKKVTNDLLRFGEVQRALLGISIRDVDAELAEAKNIPDTRGVYVAGIMADGGASKSGLKEGDVILKIENVDVNSVSALQEYVARYRPGDKLTVTYERGKDIAQTKITLRSADGSDKLAKANARKPVESRFLQATLLTTSPEAKAVLGIKNGVEVLELDENSLLGTAGIQPSFIITHIDKKPVSKPEDVEKLIRNTRGGILVEGVYPDGRKMYYAVGA